MRDRVDGMAEQDVRWHQRLNSYQSALRRLTEAVELGRTRTLSDLERQGLIKGFEVTHELAWNLLKEYLTFQGIQGIIGSRDAVREGFQAELIADGEIWMDMIVSRNRTSHIYHEDVAADIAARVVQSYLDQYARLEARMVAIRDE